MAALRPTVAFLQLNRRKRANPNGLTARERQDWRELRCQIESVLFGQPMDPEEDTREFLRVPAAMPAQVMAAGRQLESRVTVLGENGCFLASYDLLPVGTPLEIEMRASLGGLPLRVKGVVVWNHTGQQPDEQGMGIQFIDLNSQQRQLLFSRVDGILKEKMQTDRGPIRTPSVKVRVLTHRGMAEAHAVDLTIQGMTVLCPIPVRQGENLGVEISLNENKPPLRSEAKVVRLASERSQARTPGFGVRFLSLLPEDEERLKRYLLHSQN